MNIERSVVESDLIFAGLFLLQNPLKPDSKYSYSRIHGSYILLYLVGDTLHTLRDASIRSVIITGDNALTAINVARDLDLCHECLLIDITQDAPRASTQHLQDANDPYHAIDSFKQLVCYDIPTIHDLNSHFSFTNPNTLDKHEGDPLHQRDRGFPISDLIDRLSGMSRKTELALTGPALDLLSHMHDYDFLNWVIGRTRIFARAKPHHKTWIIESLIKQGRVVGMCGDGTNDCGALVHIYF